MSKVIYGKNGVRTRDYRVWINFEDMHDYDDELDYIVAVDLMGELYTEMQAATPDPIQPLIDLKGSMYHVGEMRADSIDLSVEDGDSVNGNEVGKLVIGKNGKFSTELINATPEIIAWLAERDGKQCIIMLEEINESRVKDYDDAMLKTSEIILIGNAPEMAAGVTDGVGVVFHYSDKITGNNIAISNITAERNIPTVSSFRSIFDARTESIYPAPEILTFAHQGGPRWSLTLAEYTTPGPMSFRVEYCDNDNTFSNILKTEEALIADGGFFLPEFTESIVGPLWARVCCMIGGVQKTPYDTAKAERT